MKEDSRYREVKEALLGADWKDEDLLFEPVMYVQSRIYRPDIVLLYNLFPLAVVEITLDLVSPELIAFDARERAEALGIPFALITDQKRILAINTLSSGSLEFVDFPTPKDLWSSLGREWDLNDPRLYPPYLEQRVFSLYQAVAVSRVIEAVLNGQRGILLAMTPGTGRTWVLFQVAWKLIQAGYCHRMLYLTDLVLQREQIKERFRPLDQNVHVLSKTHPPNASTCVHMATVSQLRTDETSHSLLSLPVDFYDLIFLESKPNEKVLLPIFEHFSMATRVAIDNVKASTFPPDYVPVFTYTGHDVFETEYAEPPDGFVATRLADIAEIHRGTRSRGSAIEVNSSPGSAICYFITPSNLQADGVLLPDSKSVIARADLEDQFTLKPGDILLTTFTTGAQNRVVMVPKDIPEPMTFNDSLIRIRVDPQRADSRAVFVFLQSDTGQRILRLMASGMVIARLTERDVAGMQVFLPKIVGITDEAIKLGAAMRAIHEIKDRILPLLEQAEQDYEQSTANPEETPNLRAAAERLRDLASTLVPPSLAELVTTEYPIPVALAYRRFQDAQFDVYQQLLRLRDLFEAASYYLFHIVLADIVHNLDPQKYFIEDRGARRAYNGFSMAGRISFVSAILQIASRNKGQDLFIPELVDLIPILDSARYIQDDFRNRLSHTSTAHEGIAERTLRTFKPLVEQLLEQFEFLTRYPLVRISSFVVRQGRWVRRMVVYKGVIPRSEEETLSLLPIYPSAESDHLVLLGGEDKVLDLYPLYQLLTNEETRFETHLCFLKQRKQGERRLEGESIQGAFEIQLDGFDEFERLQQKILDRGPA